VASFCVLELRGTVASSEDESSGVFNGNTPINALPTSNATIARGIIINLTFFAINIQHIN